MLHKNPDSLTGAILHTVSYADIFDYPITIEEIHHYLIGWQTSFEDVQNEVSDMMNSNNNLASDGEYYFLKGHDDIVSSRQDKNAHAATLWRQARRYGYWISHLPFVRMVGVTGSLANNNVERNSDLDYLIVTEPGFLWLCRVMILALTRVTSLFGSSICPNYLLASNVLSLSERDLFTAQELARMVPVAGIRVYHEFRNQNSWTAEYLPNADDYPLTQHLNKPMIKPLQRLAEPVLRTAIGRKLEAWEMTRKITKLSAQVNGHTGIHFSADRCKGHFEDHGSRIMAAFQSKVEQIKVDPR